VRSWYGDHDGPYYPAFWNFGAGGVSIFDVTGNLLKTLPNTQICQPYESGGAMVDTCNYYVLRRQPTASPALPAAGTHHAPTTARPPS